LGKAMLAFLPANEVQDIVKAQPMIARTPKTHTTIEALLADLEQVRARGYSIENGENSPTSCCVGVPIFDNRDRPIAAISVSARALDPLVKDIDDVLRTAELISHIL
jgi:DNA-binding IclR family transcriptional regulator